MKKKIMSMALAAGLAQVSLLQAATIEFTEVVTPKTDLEKRMILTSQYAALDGNAFPIGFHTILRSGDKGSYDQISETFGQLYDVNGDPLYEEDGSARISNDNDFASLLVGTDNNMYMVSHFESRPGAMFLTLLEQGTDGNLTALTTRHLDFSDIHGGWVHCAGSVTPWGSHLGSEEYEPDASQRDHATGSIDDYYDAMGAYYGGDLLSLNPYHYGYPIEVKVNNYYSAPVTKHFAMGRVAIELAYVLPDQQTVYISDDGTNVGLFRFEADTPGNLSAGTLYAAKYNQTVSSGMGAATISWVNLGHATNAEVEAYLGFKANGAMTTTFTDIFESGEADGAGGCVDQSFTPINTTYSQETPEGYECLKLKPGMELAASRLETRRYAAMLGATTEWRKMEGITYNPQSHQLYLAMSEIGRGMEDMAKFGVANDTYDLGGTNDIRMDGFNTCGGVYVLDLDQNYDATSITGLVQGTPMVASYGAAADSPNYDGTNKCDVNGLANPDNITFLPGTNTLIIGEDTGSGHQNDLIWAMDVTTKKLTRIQTTPYGSETTSPYVHAYNGWGYIMSVVQHPYGESDSDMLVSGSGAERGYTGYIGPFPLQ